MTTFPACSKFTVILPLITDCTCPRPQSGRSGMAHQHARLEILVHRTPSRPERPTVTRPDLSELVSVRLCHDLISPMGAIGNGLELMQLSGGGAGAPELALVNDSLATALAKLRFFRIAFGPADPQGRLSIDEATQITDAMFHGRFTVPGRRPPATCPAPRRG